MFCNIPKMFAVFDRAIPPPKFSASLRSAHKAQYNLYITAGGVGDFMLGIAKLDTAGFRKF